ncbi:barwin-like endoglucanase [Aureobasidium namibiae CBS 147.97]|uniref:Barwin-like endoglucanase n=1 Tax=Aureobasidium namibiae CBS 147.97 TaxID=1043004 RepID=A0A074WBL7_9PEZI
MLFSSSNAALAAAVVLAPLAIAAPATSPNPALYERALNEGKGTWYGENCGEEACWQQGACAFTDYVLPSTIAGSTCVSETIWANGADCGGCVEISYKGGAKKIAMVTNKTGGDKNHLDMSPDMFSQLANKNLGEIPIEWQFVPCPITDGLQIKMHGGASQYWFAATVFNARLRTTKLEVSADSGKTWKATTRNVNNYFALSGNGGTNTKTAWVRVTSENGDTVVVKDVDMTSGKTTKGTANYKA